MSGDDAAKAVAARLGFSAGQLIGEIGYDEDVDHDLRSAVEAVIGSELIDLDNADDVVDSVLLWWRDEDGDVADGLVDALTLLADTGVIWLLTPRTGQDGYIDPSDVVEALQIAGLAQTTTIPYTGAWVVARIARAKQGKVR